VAALEDHRKPFLDRQEQLAGVPPFEDPGRARLLAVGFRLLGGISPFLLLWLGALAACPVILWASFELFEAGWPVAGTLFPLAFVSLTYVVGCLALPYSAVGFYFVALLAVTPLAVYALLGRRTTGTGLLVRILLAGSLFGLCSLCRGDTPLLFGGFALALVLATFRVAPRRSTPFKALAALGALVLFAVPYGLMRPSHGHNVWASLWEGLGDFDRTKGHESSDVAASRFLDRSGIHLAGPLANVIDENAEDVFRRSVLSDIRSDPAWYGGILARRLFWALTQEGLTRWHWIGFRAHRWRMPPALMMGPTWSLFWRDCSARGGEPGERRPYFSALYSPASASPSWSRSVP
jgi:hypothetical protein